jgi:hypothetical protein
MKDEAPEREAIMQQWDRWRKMIAGGFAGSLPRDEFEALIDGLLPRADAPPTLAEAMRCGDVRELVGHATAAAFTLRLLSKMDGDKCDQLQKGLLGIIARLKGETP